MHPAHNIFTLPPAPELAALVQAYWFVEDLPGKYVGCAIQTSPVPFAVLSVNLGRPNATQEGVLVPRTSLLGIQSRVRCWRSFADTYFVMVMLTVRGIVALFPDTGADSANALLDLGAMTGDASANALASGVDMEMEPRRIGAQLDRWLVAKLKAAKRHEHDAERIWTAHGVLNASGNVEAAARAAHVSRRQLHRWYRRHFGMGPKALSDLERLHRSLRAVQTGKDDPLCGFSDQAHQTRSWQRRLGVSPGSYARAGGSMLARQFSPNFSPDGTAPSFYL